MIAAPPHARRAPLGHRPARPARSVERDIDAGMVQRIAPPALLVIRREDRAQKRDDRQPEGTAVGEGIDIPPGVATGRNVRIEAKSFITVAAARRPDKAAIGTPAPGW